MLIGFTAGRYKNEEFFLKKLKLILDIGANTIELHPRIDSPKDFEISGKCIDFLNKNFKYISLHAPAANFIYDNSKFSKKIYNIVDKWMGQIDIKNVVIHPNLIKNSDEIIGRGWPISIENMDVYKNYGKNVADLKKSFVKIPSANLVLDLNHVYTNDPSMGLADEITQNFGSVIREYHISAYIDKNNIHEPFTRANCDFILEKVINKNLPIVIEINTDELNRKSLKLELEHVKNFIGNT